MRIVAMLNQKGGVGKTTSTVNLGYGLAAQGRKVLLVDLDAQANLTYSVGIAAHEVQVTILDVLKRTKKASEVIQSQHGVDVMPASLDLSSADMELSGIPGRELLLREALATVSAKYDYILLDCPPSLGLLPLNALTAASEVFVILQTEFLALQGVSKLVSTVEVVKSRLNPALEISGIIATMYDARKRLSKEVIEQISAYFGPKLFKSFIRENVSLAEAPSHGKNIFSYRPDSPGAVDYKALSKEIVSMEARYGKDASIKVGKRSIQGAAVDKGHHRGSATINSGSKAVRKGTNAKRGDTRNAGR